MCMHFVTFLAIATGTLASRNPPQWIFITGGCSGRGVQWIGVTLYNKIVYIIMRITTPCFHCTPLC